MPCCPHPVERHAYNGCANCGCSVLWVEHPDRLLDASPAGFEANKDLLLKLAKAALRLRANYRDTSGSMVRIDAIEDSVDELVAIVEGKPWQNFT